MFGQTITNDLFPLRMCDSAELSTVPFLVCHCKLEPLAVVLVTSQVVSISRGGLQHKLALCAVDLLLFVSSPDRSIPALLAYCKLKHFGGYKLKTLIRGIVFPLMMPFQPVPSQTCHLGHLWKALNVLVFVDLSVISPHCWSN